MKSKRKRRRTDYKIINFYCLIIILIKIQFLRSNYNNDNNNNNNEEEEGKRRDYEIN